MTTKPISAAEERRRREIGRTQQDILEATARVYARHGFEGTTVRRIAEEAGYTPAALYSYFQGKEHILDGLRARMREAMLETFDVRQMPRLAFADQLELLLVHQLELVQDQWQSFLVFFLMRGEGPSAQSELAESTTGFAVVHERLRTWLVAAGAEQALAIPVDQAADILVGLIIGMFRAWLRQQGAESLAQTAHRIVHVFVHGAGRGVHSDD